MSGGMDRRRAIASIGGISLIVAGMSIFNVMMMSVTERTKEIEVRNEVLEPRKGRCFRYSSTKRYFRASRGAWWVD